MPRNYVRKSTSIPSEELLHKAVSEVLSVRLTIRKAAEQFGLKHATVGFYSKRHFSSGLFPPEKVKKLQHSSQIIPAKLELELGKYLKDCALINHGLSTRETSQLAYSFAIANEIVVPTNWTENESASQDWMIGFLKRNSFLSIRKPEKTSQARAAGFNKPVVSSYYDQLSNVMTRYKFSAHQVWNCDETSNQTVMQPPKIIAEKGTKLVQQTVSAERGVNVTMLAFINAAGGTVPTVFIFPRKKLVRSLYENGPTGCIGFSHESGWMTGSNFFKCLQHFQSFVKCSKENPVLMTLDNHCSHLDYQAVTFAKDNGIVLLTFPPHCSHALQSLDVSVFGPYKKAFANSQNEWLHSNPGGRISIKDIPKIASGPFLSTFTPSNIISGFKATGIFPMNRNAIKEARYAPSFVTDRPSPTALDDSLSANDQATENTVDTLFSNTPLSADVVISCLPSDEAGSVNVTGNINKLSLTSTIADLMELFSAITPPVKQTTGTSLTSTTDGVIKSHVSPLDIRPFPQVSQSIQIVPRPKTNSRAGSAKILTDTPEKNKIELEHKKNISRNEEEGK